MEPAPSLREVFAALAGGSANPAEALNAAGYGDLPGELVAEAIVNFADAAPVEVADHLSGFVKAHSPVPQSDPQNDEAATHAFDTHDGLSLLASAPADVEVPDGDPRGDPFGDEAPGLVDHDAQLHDAQLQDPQLDDTSDHDGFSADHHPADLFFGVGEPGLDAAPVEHEAGPEASGFDPAGLDASGPMTWLDVTSSQLGSPEDTDWTSHAGPSTAQADPLAAGLDHDHPGDGPMPDEAGT